MIFTSDAYANIIDYLSTHKSTEKTRATQLKKTASDALIVYAIDVETYLREIYIEISEKPTQVNFPHWKGVEIFVANIPEYTDNDKFFLALRQVPQSDGHIFEIVAEDLFDELNKDKMKSDAMKTIAKVLLKWKSFFLLEREILLPIERQHGLYSELLMLKELIDKYGHVSVTFWLGCSGETHDFYIAGNAIEVKSTTMKAPYKMSISSEFQLDKNDVSRSLFLRFYAMRCSEGDGEKIPEIIQQIENMLCGVPLLQDLFIKKLGEYGYIGAGRDLYTLGYRVREVKTFHIGNGFPCITKADLMPGVGNLTYLLYADECTRYRIDDVRLYSLLNGEVG